MSVRAVNGSCKSVCIKASSGTVRETKALSPHPFVYAHKCSNSELICRLSLHIIAVFLKKHLRKKRKSYIELYCSLTNILQNISHFGAFMLVRLSLNVNNADIYMCSKTRKRKLSFMSQ